MQCFLKTSLNKIYQSFVCLVFIGCSTVKDVHKLLFIHFFALTKSIAEIKKGPYSIQDVMMETLNQFVARHTYPEFIAKLDGTAVHQTRILAEGIGYGPWVKNFQTFIDELSINELSIVEDMKGISFNSKWSNIHQDIAELLSDMSKKDKTAIITCMEILRRHGNMGGFKELIHQMLQ